MAKRKKIPSEDQFYMFSLIIDAKEKVNTCAFYPRWREIELELKLKCHGLWHGKADYQKYFDCVDIDFLVDAIEGNDKKEETKNKWGLSWAKLSRAGVKPNVGLNRLS